MIKIVFTDIDGVWTNDKYYYGPNGSTLRKFSTKDSAGILFLNKLGIKTVAVTGDNSSASKKRFNDLGVRIYSNEKNKLSLCKMVLNDLNISAKDALYIGNDINDLECIKFFQISYCPSTSPDYIRKFASNVLNTKPGDGFFRDVIEHYLVSQKISIEDLVTSL